MKCGGGDRGPAGGRGRQHVGAGTYAASVDLSGLVQKSSSVTITEFQGYVWRAFHVAEAEAGATFSLACTGLHTVAVDGRPYQADVYASGQLFAVLPGLRAGLHRVTSRIAAKVRPRSGARFKARTTAPGTTAPGTTAPETGSAGTGSASLLPRRTTGPTSSEAHSLPPTSRSPWPTSAALRCCSTTRLGPPRL